MNEVLISKSLYQLLRLVERSQGSDSCLELNESSSNQYSNDFYYQEICQLTADKRLQLSYHLLVGILRHLPDQYTELSLQPIKSVVLNTKLNLANQFALKLFYNYWKKLNLLLQFELNLYNSTSPAIELTLRFIADPYYILIHHQLPAKEAIIKYIQLYFDLACCSIKFAHRLIKLAINYQCRLDSHFKFNQLGINSILGNHAQLINDFCIIYFKKIEYDDFLNLLNNQNKLQAIWDFLSEHNAMGYQFILEFKVEINETQGISLGVNNDLLGWNSWLDQPAGIASVSMQPSIYNGSALN